MILSDTLSEALVAALQAICSIPSLKHAINKKLLTMLTEVMDKVNEVGLF